MQICIAAAINVGIRPTLNKPNQINRMGSGYPQLEWTEWSDIGNFDRKLFSVQ